MEFIADFKDLADDKRFIQDTKEIVVNKMFHQPTESFFNIVPGIKGGQQVAAMKNFEYVTVKSAGCGGNGISPTFPAFSQFWNPQLQEVKIELCYTEFEGSYLQWALKNGYDRKNLDGTTMALFLQELVIDAMALDLQRMVLMSDKDIAAQDILTDEAGKAKFYNTFDKGLIPTLQYLATLPEFADQFIELSKNDGAQTDQYNLPADYALNLYENVLETYDFDGDILLTSNRLHKNYEAWVRRANGYGVQGNIDTTINGVQNPKIAGKTLTPVVNYDRWRAKDFVTGVPAHVHIPHFALYTQKDFLQVGVDDVGALSDLRFEYIGGADEKLWIKGNYMLDFKMVNPYAMKAAL